MCGMAKTHLKRKQAAKQAAAIAVLLCFVVLSLISEIFILTHANHEHDHAGADGTCAACAQLLNAENMLKQLGAVITVSFLASAGLFAPFSIISAVCSNTAISTPVTLKIRMNN